MRTMMSDPEKGERFRRKMSERLTLGIHKGTPLSMDEIDDLAYIWQEVFVAHMDFPLYEIASDGSRRELPDAWQRDMYTVYGLFEDDRWWEDFELQDKSPLDIEEALRAWLSGVPADDVVA